MLFDTFDATDLNKELKALMDGLSVKVSHAWCALEWRSICASANTHKNSAL
jgi:hypothetical protein